MQSLVFELRAHLTEFIEQRNDLLLILKGDQAGISISVNSLRELEQNPGTDLFLVVSGAFGNADSIADCVVEQVRVERDIACQAMLELGREPLPELPPSLDADVAPPQEPAERIKIAIQYASSLLEPEGNHRLVVGLFPSGIGIPDAYHALIRQLAPTSGLESWMQGVRIICCDHSSASVKSLNSLPRVRLANYDLSHESIQDAIYKDVQNESLTDSHRVNAVYQLAIFDCAYDRPDEALEKYDYLLGYFQGTENEVMQAMIMHSIGDVYRKLKQPVAARHWYECATSPAIHANSRQTLQMILRSLGELERECGNERKSQIYFAQMREFSNVNGDVLSVLHAERAQAQSFAHDGRSARAIATLEQSAHRCRSLGLEFELELTLMQLLPIYRSRDADLHTRDVEQELELLRTTAGAP